MTFTRARTLTPHEPFMRNQIKHCLNGKQQRILSHNVIISIVNNTVLELCSHSGMALARTYKTHWISKLWHLVLINN